MVLIDEEELLLNPYFFAFTADVDKSWEVGGAIWKKLACKVFYSILLNANFGNRLGNPASAVNGEGAAKAIHPITLRRDGKAHP